MPVKHGSGCHAGGKKQNFNADERERARVACDACGTARRERRRIVNYYYIGFVEHYSRFFVQPVCPAPMVVFSR